LLVVKAVDTERGCIGLELAERRATPLREHVWRKREGLA
jgi:hypothetical protein